MEGIDLSLPLLFVRPQACWCPTCFFAPLGLLWFVWRGYFEMQVAGSTPPNPRKLAWRAQNDGLEKVAPFEYGHFWYLC